MRFLSNNHCRFRLIELVVVFLFLSVFVTYAHSNNKEGTDVQDAEGLRCRILSFDLDYDPSEEGQQQQEEQVDQLSFACLTDGEQEKDGAQGMTYMIDLPPSFVKKHSHLEDGETYVVIPSGHAIHHGHNGVASIVYPNATDIVTVSPPPTLGRRRRRLSQHRRQGTKSLLVVRVDGSDSMLALSQQDLSKRIFGIGSGAPAVNVRSQYHACSFGKFRIVPATGSGITDGVTSVSIGTVKNKNPFNLENHVVSAVQRKIGVSNLGSTFDHVMICLPPGTLYNGVRARWYAYGYLGWYRTVYNNEWCGYYSVPVHEIGHNLNFRHSGHGSVPYGDQTGMMGYSYAAVGAPSMCFNGYKNWLLGWYSDRSISISGMTAWSGRLYAFVDYDRTPQDSFVVIRIKDLYVQYNRGRRFNSGTQELKNRVTITLGLGEDKESKLLGGVGLGSSGGGNTFRFRNFGNTGRALVIEACEEVYGPPDYVRISIYLDNQQSKCVTPSPRTSPTPRPTPAPTPRPTPSPTPKPTPKPTASPTKSPTPRPSILRAPRIGGVCDDSKTSFRLHPDRAAPLITCRQIASNHALRNSTCVPTHQAYTECEETCGVCSDECTDSTETFYVTRNLPSQDCDWLRARPQWHPILCYPTHPAYSICGETCDGCDGYPGHSDPEYRADCEDSTTGTFFLDSSRKRNCLWLSVNPIWHSRMCVAGKAYDICPETCGVCTDHCDDDPNATFYVNSNKGTKDCKWLSIRPDFQKNLCYDGHSAYAYCKESCNSCYR